MFGDPLPPNACSRFVAVFSAKYCKIILSKYQNENLLNCKSKRLRNPETPLFIGNFHTLRHSSKQFLMAREVGFEPTTLGLEDRCSIQLSYSRKYPPIIELGIFLATSKCPILGPVRTVLHLCSLRASFPYRPGCKRPIRHFRS